MPAACELRFRVLIIQKETGSYMHLDGCVVGMCTPIGNALFSGPWPPNPKFSDSTWTCIFCGCCCWIPLTSWFPKHDTWKIAKLKDGKVGRFRKLADSLSMCLECWKLRCASSNFPVFTISSCHAGKHEEQRTFLRVMRRISHSHNDNSGRNTKTNSLSSPLATHSPPPVAALSFLLRLCAFGDAVSQVPPSPSSHSHAARREHTAPNAPNQTPKL